MSGSTDEIIPAYKQADTTEADFFSSDIPADIVRNIHGILVGGNTIAAVVVTIKQRDGSDSDTTIMVPVISQSDSKIIGSPGDTDVVVICLKGGENLRVVTDANTAGITAWYTDSEL